MNKQKQSRGHGKPWGLCHSGLTVLCHCVAEPGLTWHWWIWGLENRWGGRVEAVFPNVQLITLLVYPLQPPSTHIKAILYQCHWYKHLLSVYVRELLAFQSGKQTSTSLYLYLSRWFAASSQAAAGQSSPGAASPCHTGNSLGELSQKKRTGISDWPYSWTVTSWGISSTLFCVLAENGSFLISLYCFIIFSIYQTWYICRQYRM